jgi:hypothetical protein
VPDEPIFVPLACCLGSGPRWHRVRRCARSLLQSSVKHVRYGSRGTCAGHGPNTRLRGSFLLHKVAGSRRRRRLAERPYSACIAGGTVIPDVGPEPPDPGLAVAGSEHGDRSIVGMKLARRHHVSTDRLDQGSEQLAGGADPSSQRRAIEIESFARVDFRLSIQRDVICILRDQHMGQQSRACQTTIDRS